MRTSMKKIILAASVAGLIATPAVFADGHKFEISGGVGYQNFDNNRDLERAASYGIGLGYVIDPRWTVETWWQETNTDVDGSSTDVDATEYRLDGLYHLASDSNWKPFIVAGIGDMTFDPQGGDDSDETRVNLGVGLKNALSENLDFRGDVRLFNGLDSEQTDMGLLLALTYKLGHTAATPAPAPVAMPVDTDGDGVYDDQDQCPDTAKNLKVDANGCPIKLSEAVEIKLEVKFANNSAVVNSQYSNEIKRVADFMGKYDATVVEIQGHTDSRGEASYNKSLSQKRANAVAKVLVSEHGIAADRVTAVGYGEANPTASNDAIEGRAANRRVVAEVSSVVEKMEER